MPLIINEVSLPVIKLADRLMSAECSVAELDLILAECGYAVDNEDHISNVTASIIQQEPLRCELCVRFDYVDHLGGQDNSSVWFSYDDGQLVGEF